MYTFTCIKGKVIEIRKLIQTYHLQLQSVITSWRLIQNAVSLQSFFKPFDIAEADILQQMTTSKSAELRHSDSEAELDFWLREQLL